MAEASFNQSRQSVTGNQYNAEYIVLGATDGLDRVRHELVLDIYAEGNTLLDDFCRTVREVPFLHLADWSKKVEYPEDFESRCDSLLRLLLKAKALGVQTRDSPLDDVLSILLTWIRSIRKFIAGDPTIQRATALEAILAYMYSSEHEEDAPTTGDLVELMAEDKILFGYSNVVLRKSVTDALDMLRHAEFGVW